MDAFGRETFMYRGKQVTRCPEPRYEMWVSAADIGQRQDHTALCALQHTREPLHDAWEYNERSGMLRQKVVERFAVRGLCRLPLDMDYTQQAIRVRELMLGPPLYGRADLVLDDTGVGTAVGDIFVNDGRLSPVRITITSGLR
jgi:hypothetical protein